MIKCCKYDYMKHMDITETQVQRKGIIEMTKPATQQSDFLGFYVFICLKIFNNNGVQYNNY